MLIYWTGQAYVVELRMGDGTATVISGIASSWQYTKRYPAQLTHYGTGLFILR